MTMHDNPLCEMTRVGTLEALSEIASAFPGDELVGFALLTDDDLSGVFHAACTAQFAKSSEEDGIQFMPNDWNQGSKREPPGLVQAEQYLQAQQALGKRHHPIADDFRAMVAGVAAARVEASVDDGVFFTVGSTDPSDPMERLEEEALVRLNSQQTMAAWHRWNIRESRAWLDRLESKSPPLSYADEHIIQMLRADIARREALLPDAG